MKILYVDLGGVKKYNCDKMAGRVNTWAHLGSRVTIYIPSFMGMKVLENNIQEKVVKIYAWFSSKEFGSSIGIVLAYGIRTITSFQILFNNQKYDIGFSNSPVIVDIAPILWLKFFKKCSCWVLMIDSLVPPPNMRSGSRLINFITYLEAKVVRVLAKKFASKIFTVNPEIRDALIKYGFNQKSIFISKNGLFLDRIGSYHIENKIYDAVYMGRITENKGVFDLLKCWKMVIKDRPLAKLAIMGTGRGDVVRSFLNQIAQLSLQENVKYFGYIGNEKKYEILKQSKIQIFLSKVNADESWGISLMEGLACGLPAVTYDLEIYKHVYDAGILVAAPVGDVNITYKLVRQLLGDDRYRVDLSNKGVKFSRQFDWANISAVDLEQLRGLVAKN